MVHVPLMFLSEWPELPSAPYLTVGDLTARVSMLLKSRASPYMLPFSLCNKKTLAVRHTNRPLFPTTLDSVLRHREVGRAKDLSAPHRIGSCVIHRLPPNKYWFFIMQFFRTCDKCKGNMLYKGRMLACSGWRRRLKQRYNHNKTGSIPDRNKIIFYTWRVYVVNSACTNKDYHLFFSRSENYR